MSYDLTEVMVSEIIDSIKDLPGNVLIYFDFLVSNGLSNRFYSASASVMKRGGKLKRCQNIPRKYEHLSDDFFRGNYEYVKKSVLSSSQRELFK